jgi:biopolymer transport protein ExbD
MADSADTSRPSSPAEPAPDQVDDTIHHTSARQRRRQTPPMGQLNLTAMLDVTFQLLIFFVVTVSFAPNEGVLEADLPAGAGIDDPTKLPDNPINIVLVSLGQGPVGGQSVRIDIQVGTTVTVASFEELYQQLRAMHQEEGQGNFRADNPIIIKPGPEVAWDDVISAFNSALRAKYTNINFARAT